jgi:glycosyltransferase involved in cell wall biosynthesis
MAEKENKLRVAFISGGLGVGGAEKQFIYMLRALQRSGIELRVLTLTHGEFYENTLTSLGITPVRITARGPAQRIIQMRAALKDFHPHFIQATHFYTSFYAGILGRLNGSTAVGAIRNDLIQDLRGVGRYGPLILRLPDVFLANSYNALENAEKVGLQQKRIHVLTNVIDLREFDQRIETAAPVKTSPDCIRVVAVARLMPVKKLERFLFALALARQQSPAIRGLLIGSGPEDERLRKIAEDLGLMPDGVEFLGARDDVPQILFSADIFVLTSDREGFPNVLLEAMAASLPIISTPAGEVKDIVKEGVNGFLVPYDDVQQLVTRLLQLATQPELQAHMGQNGRQIVEDRYSFEHLSRKLENFYRAAAVQQNNKKALTVLGDGSA